MSPEHSSFASEVATFARSDASRTAIRDVFFEKIEAFVAIMDLLRRGQILNHFTGTWDWSRGCGLEDAREVELVGTTHLSGRMFIDDSSSAAIFETGLPSIWHIEQQAREIHEWRCLPSGPRTSTTNFSSAIPGNRLASTAAEVLLNQGTLIDRHARARLKGYEEVVRLVTRIAADLSVRRKLELISIRVRPAWSNEYDETTGIVIQIELKGSSDDRFSYWEALGQEVDILAAILPANQSDFLDTNVSMIVSRK